MTTMTAIQDEYLKSLSGPWSDIQGHLAFLHQAAELREGAVVIELGVRTGESTRAFLSGVSKSGGQLWSCDINPPQVPDVIRNHPRWHFVQADDLSDEASGFLPPTCDVLFLDAHPDNWTPEQLAAHLILELEIYGPRVRQGGIIAVHDTQWQPPNIDLGAPIGGVAQGLSDWCEKVGYRWNNRPGHYGLGVASVPYVVKG